MPFIEPERRDEIVSLYDCKSPGERCFWFYRWMVKEWNENPRWATADSIYKRVKSPERMFFETSLGDADNQRAKELAWQVFFMMYIFPYELKKQELHGDIE